MSDLVGALPRLVLGGLDRESQLDEDLTVGRSKFTRCPWLPAHQLGFGLQLDSTGEEPGGAEARKCFKGFGGPGEIRTHDLFHAMEARSQLRHRPSRV